MNFAGKNILMISPPFFGYEGEIAESLRSQGALVDYISDRPFESTFMKGFTRLFAAIVAKNSEKYYIKKIQKFNKKYDYILVINGEALSGNLLLLLRKMFERAKFILFMWDSFKNRANLERNIPLYDRAFTFDKEDAKKFNISFRPLFFSDYFKNLPESQIIYDLSFVGTAHSDRYRIIKNIKKNISKDRNFFYFLYLQAHWLFYFYRIFKKSFCSARLKEFEYKSISKEQVRNIFLNSFAILDIEHPNQLGLTIRTFEALGARKKLVTTNSDISTYDFYHPDNILIIDRKGFCALPETFFSKDYHNISEDLYDKYSLAGWLKDIFNI